MTNKWKAPFSDEQIDILRAYQKNPDCHPYTCLCCTSHLPLLVRSEGLFCSSCHRTQHWSHTHDVKLKSPNPEVAANVYKSYLNLEGAIYMIEGQEGHNLQCLLEKLYNALRAPSINTIVCDDEESF